MLPAIGVIRFKGAVPEGADRLLKDVTVGVEIRLVPDAGYSADELAQRVIAAHRAVWSTGRVVELESHFDLESGQVHLTGRPTSAPLDDGAMKQALADTISALPDGMQSQVQLVLRNDFRSTDDARNGGGRLELIGENFLECTAGFNVVNSSGVTGVATAGHCGNGMTHENTAGDAEWLLTFQAQHRGEWGDFQWHVSGDTEPDNFYPYAGSASIDVANVANPALGQTLCRFGHKTGKQCDTVADLNLCVTANGVENCHLVRMDHDEADGGDSGGPWYSGGTAYGFHKGSTDCGWPWQSCDVWSRATYIDEALGVSVQS